MCLTQNHTSQLQKFKKAKIRRSPPHKISWAKLVFSWVLMPQTKFYFNTFKFKLLLKSRHSQSCRMKFVTAANVVGKVSVLSVEVPNADVKLQESHIGHQHIIVSNSWNTIISSLFTWNQCSITGQVTILLAFAMAWTSKFQNVCLNTNISVKVSCQQLCLDKSCSCVQLHKTRFFLADHTGH